MLDRLHLEVAYCAREVPGILPSELKPAKKEGNSSGAVDGTAGKDSQNQELVLLRYEDVPMETDVGELDVTLKAGEGQGEGERSRSTAGNGALTCMPERAALIKSILNFLKKAIPEPTFAENIRNCEYDRT